MADIVQQIEMQIAERYAEIAKFEAALEVIRQVSGKPSAGGKAKSQQPLFTVRKSQPTLAAPKTPKAGVRQSPAKTGVDWKHTVCNVLQERGPLPSGEIAAVLGVLDHKQDKQAVYNALSALKINGFLERDAQGNYSILRAWGSQGGSADTITPDSKSADEDSAKAA